MIKIWHFVFSLGVFLAVGCKNQSTLKDSIYFGGEIINPLSDKVLLYHGEFPIDTLYLNEENIFFSQVDSIKSGIYQLDLLVDAQDILIEPGDSLWIRVNTQGVRESVFFSGYGAAKNNFISDMVLKIEGEEKRMDYSLTAQEFSRHIDSLVSTKKEEWRLMNDQTDLSPFAQKVTQAAYIYSYSNRRERYALLRGTKFSESDSLFYNYRTFLGYGDSDLKYFYPYISYLLNYISEIAVSDNTSFSQTLFSKDFNLKRLEVLEMNIFDEQLKNYLARIIALEELMKNPERNSNEIFLNKYSEVNTSEYYLSEVLGLVENLSLMSPGKELPIVSLQDANGNILSSDNLFTGQPVVLYFWSQTSVSFFSTQLERLQELKNKYPKYRFVGISLEPFNNLMHQMLETIDVSISDHYAFVDFKQASRDWVIQIWNKSIVANAEGKIIEGFGNFVDEDFEKLLANYN
ncbi:MAG: redoxin domain-containing protein [Flavobacteriaceae bacterium]|nr:redoxin domain-containing protein [Flavobacteriaceae bacterium]